MKKPLFTILMILFAITTCMDFASAETETNILKNSQSEEVLATEEGNLNISFDNGYHGYCINYGDHEAKIGSEYSVENTSYATNKNTGESVGNYLKVYFVDYYDDAMRDEIVTQHTIWHFTDDFYGWRLDPLLLENIKSTAATKTIPDSGAVRQINNTTEAVFDFLVLNSDKSDHQNFFAYKITYRDIAKDMIGSADSSNDTFSKKHQSNITVEEPKFNKTPEKQENISKIYENSTGIAAKDISKEYGKKIASEKEDSQNVSKSVKLTEHVTGKRTVGILLLLIVLGIVAAKYIRRD
ncbi:hypothetical protein [Methanobrevibacter sp.]